MRVVVSRSGASSVLVVSHPKHAAWKGISYLDSSLTALGTQHIVG